MADPERVAEEELRRLATASREEAADRRLHPQAWWLDR